MKTRIERRIGGEMIAVEVTIGVLEAVADLEPIMSTAHARVAVGHYRLVRAVTVQGMKAAGRADAGEWWDAAVEREGFQPMVELAEEALRHALLKAGEAAKNSDAAVKPEEKTETVVS